MTVSRIEPSKSPEYEKAKAELYLNPEGDLAKRLERIEEAIRMLGSDLYLSTDYGDSVSSRYKELIGILGTEII